MRGCRRCQPGIPTPRASLLALQQRLKRGTPSGRKRFDPQRALQTVPRMIGQIEKRVDLCDSHALSRFPHLHDFVAGSHFAFTENTEVEARSAAGCQQRWHPGFVHPNADAITCDAGLGDLEKCAADLITVADTYDIVGQTFDREVLTELSVDEIRPFQLLLPIAIRFNLINEDGSVLASMPCQVALSVSLKIQTADATAASHRILPDPGVYGASFPRDIAWKADIY